MKKVTIKYSEWGDPYPCGMLTTVKIGGTDLGSYSGGDPSDYQELARKAYRLGLKDGKVKKK